MNNWKVNVVRDNPAYPFVVIDNWYTPEEESAVWKELEFYTSSPKTEKDRAENNTDPARDVDGNPLIRATRWYPDTLFSPDKRESSTIIHLMRKQRTKEFHEIIKPCLPYSRTFLGSNTDCSMVTYYEHNDEYKEHHDAFGWTMCIWFVKEPKLFNGGNFVFTDINTEVTFKHNRAVIFPCCYYHKVTPVTFKEPPPDIGYGRYTISHFYYSVSGKS
jgi:hypothetical protein